MDWKTFFLNAEGRIGRRDFWIGFALIFGASLVAGMIPLLGALISFALIWPQVCINAKRLHDMGRTGWLMLAPFGVMVVCTVIGGLFAGAGALGAAVLGAADADNAAAGSMLAGMGVMSVFLGLGALVSFGFVLWIGLTPGQVGDNRFGPEPDRAAPFGAGAAGPAPSAPAATSPSPSASGAQPPAEPPANPPIVE